MYHLRLIKGKSYWGIVKASEDSPDVYVTEKDQADRLVSSGHFVMLDSAEESGENMFQNGCADTDGAEDELDMLGDAYGEADAESGLLSVTEMKGKTKAELIEYTKQNGIDVAGCRTKDDITDRITEALERAAVARQELRDWE